MHVWQGCDEVRADLPATSVTVGVFDGVHRGHRLLLDRVVADREQGLLPVAVTFDPHPLAVLRPELAPSLLTTMAHRLELFADAGLGGVLIVPFTGDLAAESAERFATRVLAETLRARHVVVGCNFRFGHRAAGDVGLLAELGRELGFQATVVDLAPLDRTGAGASGGSPGESDARAGDGAGSVSSTAIRAMVVAGDVEGAALALDRAHRVSGEVAAGDRRGRDLGYPTANVAVPMGMAVPADGVYAGRMRTSSDGAWRPAAVSVGTNPTFDGEERRVEAHVLDVPEGYDVYGEHADLEFVARLRPMVRFDSPDALRAQMAADVARARALLGV